MSDYDDSSWLEREDLKESLEQMRKGEYTTRIPRDDAKRLHDLIFAPGSPGEEFERTARRNSRWGIAFFILAAIGFGMTIAGWYMWAAAR